MEFNLWFHVNISTPFHITQNFDKLLDKINKMHKMSIILCNGADENQAHRCDPHGLRVQEQPLFLVCSSITIFQSCEPNDWAITGSDVIPIPTMTSYLYQQ